MYDTLFSYVDDVVLLIVLLTPTIAAIYLAGKVLVQALQAGGNVAKEGRAFWRAVRGLADEPSDPLVLAIAAKTGKTPAQVVKSLTGLVDQIIAIMPEESPHA